MDCLHKNKLNTSQKKLRRDIRPSAELFVFSLYHCLMLFFLVFRQEAASYHREKFE